MLGTRIADPFHTESDRDNIPGLGLLPVETTFAQDKRTAQVTGVCRDLPFAGVMISASSLTGYEIHTGQTTCCDPSYAHPIRTAAYGDTDDHAFSTASPDGLVWGTYMHGIFDNDEFRRQLLQALYCRSGQDGEVHTRQFRADREAAYDRLAAVVRESLDMQKLRRIMECEA